jgi:drug/metabolite transporter (DMT)-like permease
MYIGKNNSVRVGCAFVVLILSLAPEFAYTFTFQFTSRHSLIYIDERILCPLSIAPNFAPHQQRLKRKSCTSLNVNVLVDSKKEDETTAIQGGSLPSRILDTTGNISNISTVWKSRCLVIIAAMLYGTNHSAVKILEDSIPLEVGTALRFSLAAIITLPLLFQRSDDNPVKFEDTEESVSPSLMDSYGAIIGGAEVGFWNFLGYMSQAIALQTIPASTNAFVCSLAVVIVPILDFLAGKKIMPREIVGAMIAVGGVGLLQMDGLQEISSGEPIFSSGTLYSLVQPLAFGVAYWRMEFYTRRFGGNGMQLTSSQLISIAALMIGTLLWTCGGIDGIPDWSQFVTWFSNPIILQAVLWTGIVTTALTIFIETQALKTLSAAETTMLYSTEPIFGSIVAAIFLGESLGMNGVVGGAMILSGCLYSSIGVNSDANQV